MRLMRIGQMLFPRLHRGAEGVAARSLWLTFSLTVLVLCLYGLALAQTLPKPSGYVNDFARVLDQPSRQRIEQLCQELETKTGVELTVVTVNSLNGEPIEDYAVKLFQQWGIGKKDRANGLLVLVAIEERRTRMEVGYGLEPVIPDGYSGEVLRSLQPYFRANQYGPGLYAAANQLAHRIAQNAGVTLSTSTEALEPRDRRASTSSPFRLIMFGGLILLALFLLPYLLGGGGGGFMGPPMGGGRYRRGGYYGGGFGGFGGGSSGFGGGSGGFGGFGGGSSGGGGSSSGW
jgi:uncharacterized protein